MPSSEAIDALSHPVRSARLARIREYLTANRRLSVLDAVKRFQASPATIRRDFAALESGGAARKVWGGIRAADAAPPAGAATFSERSGQHVAEKRAIARAAATLVQDGDVVMIDGGSTTLGLAAELAPRRVRIVTNSLAIGAEIDRNRPAGGGADVYLLGGFLLPHANLVVGPQATAALAEYRADWCFLSCRGIVADGVMNDHALVVELEQAMIRQSRRVAVLADASKLGRTSMTRICGLDRLDRLVMAGRLPRGGFLAALRSRGVLMAA